MGVVQSVNGEQSGIQEISPILPGAPTAGNALVVGVYNSNFGITAAPNSVATPVACGNANEKVSDTTHTVTTTATIPAGALLIARVGTDNSGTGTTTEAPTHTVSGGSLTWANKEARGSGSASGSGVVGSMHTAPCPSGLASGTVLTITTNPAVTAKAIDLWYIPNCDYGSVAAVGASATTGSPTAAIDPGAIDRMVIGMIVREGPTEAAFTEDTDTTNGVWNTMTGSGTTGGTGNANVSIVGGYKRVSGAGSQTYNPTVTNAGNDWVEILIVVQSTDPFAAAKTLYTASVVGSGLFHKKLTNATDTNVVIVASGPSVSLQVYMAEHDNIVIPFVVQGLDDNGEGISGTTYTVGPPASATTDPDTVVYAMISTGGAGGPTVGSWSDSFTEVYAGGTGLRTAIATKTLTATGSPQTTRTWTNAFIPNGIMAAYKTTAGATPITSSDTGAGADAVSKIGLSNTEAASGADAAAIAAGVTTADAGSGLEGTPVIVFLVTSSDTGSGLDNVSRIAPLTTDTGSGLDDGSRIGLSNAEAATGADAAAIAASTTTADAGAGADDGSRIGLSNADSGSGLDAQAVAVMVPSSDTGSGSDAVSGIALSNTEAATGSDAATIAASATTADAGSGADDVSRIALSNTDTGSGTENNGSVAVSQSSTDASGAGADAVTRIGVSNAEAATGSDAAAIAASATTADAGSGSDDVSKVGLSNTDTGAAVDNQSVSVAQVSTDTGSGADANGTIGLSNADTGAGVDAGAVLAALAASDTLTGSDVAAVLAALSAAESGSGQDVGALLAFVADFDTGTGLDSDGTVVIIVGGPPHNITVTWGTLRRRNRFAALHRHPRFGDAHR